MRGPGRGPCSAQQSHCAEPDRLLGEPETRKEPGNACGSAITGSGAGELGTGPIASTCARAQGRSPWQDLGESAGREGRRRGCEKHQRKKGKSCAGETKIADVAKARSTVMTSEGSQRFFSDLNPGRSRGQGWVMLRRIRACVCVCAHTCGCRQPHEKSGGSGRRRGRTFRGRPVSYPALTHHGDRLCLSDPVCLLSERMKGGGVPTPHPSASRRH